MAIQIRTDSLIEYLEDKAAGASGTPSRNPDGICVLSGRLLKQNLKQTLNHHDFPMAVLGHYTTIEEVAASLLQPSDKPSQILSDGIRDRLIEGIFKNADQNPDPENQVVPVSYDGVLRMEEKRALETLAEGLPYTDEGTRESYITEFDDFLRWTDAATDVSTATQQLMELDNRFAQAQSNRALNAYSGTEKILNSKISELGLSRQQSRSHLVHEAREQVTEYWNEEYGYADWIAISGISIFDNPTLRFIEEISTYDGAPDIDIFLGKGSVEYNARRLNALSILDNSDPHDIENPKLESDVADTLLSATDRTPEKKPEEVNFIETPSDQRAVEHIAAEVRELIHDGVHPRDILILAPDAGSYKSLVEQAFETVEVPVHVETRRLYANIPAYRCFRTLVDVVNAVSNDEEITYGELVDPLRLGYCPRGKQSNRWPIEGREFTKVEQEIHRKQQIHNSEEDRHEGQGIGFSGWRSIIEDIPVWTGPWGAVKTYLSDIESLADNPPSSGDELVDVFGSYLGTYVFRTVDHQRELDTGPAIDVTRTTLGEQHATNEAEKVRGSLDEVAVHYDRVQELFGAPESWYEVGRAFSAVLGKQSYGKKQLDQYAIPLVDAGNAYYRDAEYVFFSGMNAGEFPGEASTPTFLHRNLREKVYEQAWEGDNPYHHLDSRRSSYEQALDFYQAGLSTVVSGGEVRFYHSYRDERGNEIAWSSFLDLFDVTNDDESDRPVERLSVGEWVPHPESNEIDDWREVADRIAPRERLRMLLYHANRRYIIGDEVIPEEGVEVIASRLPSHPMSALVLPRVNRHQTPPTSVTIEADEPAFRNMEEGGDRNGNGNGNGERVSVESVSGRSHHPHELDLQAQCGLKYYYYQFLYNYIGDEPGRDVPKYYSKTKHWRLGRIPYIVRENYADPRYVDKWKDITTTLLSDRQSKTDGLRQFNSREEISDWVRDKDRFSGYDMNTVYQNLVAEWELVQAELKAGITRGWGWRSGGETTVDGKELAVPSYRLDKVEYEGSTYAIPIFFTRFSKRASSSMKTCFNGDNDIWDYNEKTNELCLNCGRHGNCNYNSKYVIDHRMLAGYQNETEEYGSKVAGLGLQEQYAGPDDGNRIVAAKTNYIDRITPETSNFERVVPRGYPQNWDSALENWRENFTELADDLDIEDGIELSANPTVVNQDDCLNCVYRDLCQVPDSGVDLE